MYIYGSNANSHAIASLRVPNQTKANPFISFDHDGITGWSAGEDTQDNNRFKIANDWSNLQNKTAFSIEPSNLNVGIGGNPRSARLNIEAQGAGDPNQNGQQIYGQAGADATLSLKTANTSGNDAAVTFDHEGVSGWRMGQRANGQFILANDWRDLGANQMIKADNGRNNFTLLTDNFWVCNKAGGNCRRLA